MTRGLPWGLLACLLSVTALGSEVPQSAPQPRSAYFSLTNKGAASPFYNRLANNKYWFVASDAPVDGALASQKLSARSGERLVLVELHGVAPARLPGELARMDEFAVLSEPYNEDLHMINGQALLFGEELGAKLHSTPAATGEPSLRSPLHDLTSRVVTHLSTLNVERDFLESHVRQLSGDQPVTIAGRRLTITERRQDENKANARAYLRQEYEALGFTVTEKTYRGGWGFGTHVNFVAEKTGADPSRFLLISSHLDSVGNAGADDNGAGTISALAVAKALKDQELRYSLRILAFDEEEIGMVGSAAYAQQLQDEGQLDGLIGDINMEMTGYNSANDGTFHIIDCNENTSAELSKKFREVAERDQDLRLRFVSACTNRSDHASFWRFDKPAVVLSQNFFGGDGNPCYHKKCDKVDRMNFDYMTRMTSLLARVTQELLVP